MEELDYDPRYPSVNDLRELARRRISKFAFEYLDGGCNEYFNLYRNTAEIHNVELIPQYLSEHTYSDMRTELFGHTYDAPFGISPIGLQGLMWPKTPEILARAAFKHNIPFCLSTVSTGGRGQSAEGAASPGVCATTEDCPQNIGRPTSWGRLLRTLNMQLQSNCENLFPTIPPRFSARESCWPDA